MSIHFASDDPRLNKLRSELTKLQFSSPTNTARNLPRYKLCHECDSLLQHKGLKTVITHLYDMYHLTDNIYQIIDEYRLIFINRLTMWRVEEQFGRLLRRRG